MRISGLLSGLVLVFVATIALGTPLDFKTVSADAKWVAHVDVDAMRTSTLVQKMYLLVVQECNDLDPQMAKLRAEWGLDPRIDLHGMTLYGPQFGEPKGILIIYANVDRKKLEGKASAAKDHKTAAYGPYEIHVWTETRHGQQRPAAAAFCRPNVVVFGPSVDDVKHAIDVFDGKKASLDGKESVLTAKVLAGTTVLARATGLSEAKLPMKSSLVKQSDSMSIVMGESGEQSFFHGVLVAKSADIALEFKKIVDGGIALAGLRAGSDAAAARLVKGVKAGVNDKTVTVEFSAPVDDVWTVVEKCVKMMLEHQREWMEHHQGGKKQ
jgi:hypothetical protein